MTEGKESESPNPPQLEGSKLRHDAKARLTALKLKFQLIQRLLSQQSSTANWVTNLQNILTGADCDIDRLTELVDVLGKEAEGQER